MASGNFIDLGSEARYEEAAKIIYDLRSRLPELQRELDDLLQEGYEEMGLKW